MRFYNAKIEAVLVCPRWSYTEIIQINPKFGKKEAFDRIKQGREYRYYMLDRGDLPEHPSEIQIVDLNSVFSIPYSNMKKIALSKGKRLRLRSPYKEGLAQAFAYFHMRVALPNNLPDFQEVMSAIHASVQVRH